MSLTSTAAMMSSSESMMSDVGWVQAWKTMLFISLKSPDFHFSNTRNRKTTKAKHFKLSAESFKELNWTSGAEELASFHLKTKTHQSPDTSVLYFWWTSCESHRQKHKLEPSFFHVCMWCTIKSDSDVCMNIKNCDPSPSWVAFMSNWVKMLRSSCSDSYEACFWGVRGGK